MVFRTLILKTSNLSFFKRFMRESKLVKPLVGRFIAGETLEDAMTAAEQLAEEGFFSSLDLLGENVATEKEAADSRDAYIEVVNRIAKSPHKEKINISIKLTALGLDQGEDIAEANYRTLLEAALPHNIFIRADMEGSPYTQVTVEMVERVNKDFPGLTGTVLQAYLYRTAEDLKRLAEQNIRLRWVKGAYLEPADVAYPSKQKVDEEYEKWGCYLVEHANYPAIASQDQVIIEKIRKHAEDKQIEKSRFEWQMLFGIRRDLQNSLKNQGYNVRIYIPYGEAWYPYFTRRLAERPANMLFILKSLFRK